MGTSTDWCRKLLDLNQREFAEFIGVSTRTVENWDYRHSMPEHITHLISCYYLMAQRAIKAEEKLLGYPQAGEDPERIRKRITSITKEMRGKEK